MFKSMDSNPKRPAFPEPFLSQRISVISRFSVVVGAFLVFSSLLLLNHSVTVPKVQVFFLGPKGVDANSSFPSWHFPFSINPSSATSESQRSVSSLETLLGDFTENRGNGSLHAEEQSFVEKTVVGNGTMVSEKGNLLDPVGLASGKTGVENSSGVVKGEILFGEKGRIDANISISSEAKMVTQKTMEGESPKNSNFSSNGGAVEINNVRNCSHNGKAGNVGAGKNEEGLIDKNNETVIHLDSQKEKSPTGFYGNCNIFDGYWVRDDSNPYYPLGSCPHIDRDFDCHLNGRPDSEYVKWRWQPKGCNIPRLNATDFLERLRGQRLVFVGDSLNRNMWESMVCILRQSIKDKKRVFEISGRSKFKKNGFYAFRFEDYNCSVDFVNTPFIVRESSFQGKNGSIETLRLDLMDNTTTMYHDADIIVFNTGHWWTHEKTSRGEDYYQEGNHVYPRLKVLDAYMRALTTWAKWIDKNIDANQTQVVFRGYSVTHFRGGQWNSGGQCHKETEPISNATYLQKYPSKMRALDQVIRNMKTPVIYMNISRLTDYRKDAHPSIYRMEYKTAQEWKYAELHQDCSHWCLPGVPDIWSELLYVSLLKYGEGSWKN